MKKKSNNVSSPPRKALNVKWCAKKYNFEFSRGPTTPISALHHSALNSNKMLTLLKRVRAGTAHWAKIPPKGYPF